MSTIAEELAKLAVIDDFNRTENPLLNVKGNPANGTWKLLKPGKLIGKCEAGKGWTPNSTFSEGADGAYYTPSSFAAGGGASYVASLFRLTELPGPSTPNRFGGVWVYRDKTTPETKENGYYIRVEYLSGEGATVKLKIKLEKWVEGKVTVLKELETKEGEYKKESRFAIVVGSGKVYAFASKEKASAFIQLLEAEDNTYTEGYSAVYAAGTGTIMMEDFATGVFNTESTPGVIKAPPASAEASAPTPKLTNVSNPPPATANASAPSPAVATGPTPSATEHEPGGLPLPYPSVLANPARLGPSRFTALERKVLGIED